MVPEDTVAGDGQDPPVRAGGDEIKVAEGNKTTLAQQLLRLSSRVKKLGTAAEAAAVPHDNETVEVKPAVNQEKNAITTDSDLTALVDTLEAAIRNIEQGWPKKP